MRADRGGRLVYPAMKRFDERLIGLIYGALMGLMAAIVVMGR